MFWTDMLLLGFMLMSVGAFAGYFLRGRLVFLAYCERLAQLEQREDELHSFSGPEGRDNWYMQEQSWKLFFRRAPQFEDEQLMEAHAKLRAMRLPALISMALFVECVVLYNVHDRWRMF